MAIDRAAFLDTMANVAASVTVVTTTAEDGHSAGLTVSAFVSVSLEPPLVLVCIGKESSSLDALRANGGYTVNFLVEGQEALAMQMAATDDDKLATLRLSQPAVDGAGPVLHEGVFAYFACRTIQEVEAGDHWILIGQVEEGDLFDPETPPLVYHRRSFVEVATDQSP